MAVMAMIGAALGHRSQHPAASAAFTPSASSQASAPASATARPLPAASPSNGPRSDTGVAPGKKAARHNARGTLGALGTADGVVPDGTTVFDDEIPAVANLDAGFRKALRRAATDAARAGVKFYLNSGWRSPAYQNRLLRAAIAKYGSAAAAARWVATAARSPHVQGEAVDLKSSGATAWLSKHGAEYGLCQIYRNEPWHFELRPQAVGHGCPPMYADPSRDPRMRR